METNTKMKEISIDEMLDLVGPFGKFQKLVNFLLCVMTAPPIFQIMIMSFAADQPPWQCNSNSSLCLNYANATANTTTFFPLTNRQRCEKGWKYLRDWEYTEPKKYSVVTWYDIDCEGEWMITLLTSIFFVGWLVGAIVLGMVADNYGRRGVTIVSVTTVLFVGFVSTFMPNTYALIACRFIIGFFIPGTFAQMFILITEIVDSKHRPFSGIMIFVFALSSMSLLGVKAYFIRDWRMLQIVCTAPYAWLVFFFKFVPESVRYLNVKGKHEELMETFKRIAKVNGTTIPHNTTITPLPSTVADHTSNPLHLFRGSKLAVKSVIQTFAYFTNGLVYYGLYLAAADFGGEKYRDYIIISVAELPICFIGIDFCERFGRKKTSVVPMIVAAGACVALGYIPKEGWKKIVRVIVGMLGKCLVGSNSNTMMTWSMEMYPTVLRGEALGFFQAFMRLGAAAAPWINNEFVKLYKPSSYLFMAALALATFLLLSWLPETQGLATTDDETGDKDTDDVIGSNHQGNGDVINAFELVKSETNGGLYPDIPEVVVDTNKCESDVPT